MPVSPQASGVNEMPGGTRDNYNVQLRIDAWCDASGMSRASLHRRLPVHDLPQPLRYQKQLRLQEARQLLLAGGHRASDVAFAVGYESASQFSRGVFTAIRHVACAGRKGDTTGDRHSDEGVKGGWLSTARPALKTD